MTKFIHMRNTSDTNPNEPHHFGGRTAAFRTNPANNTIEYAYTVVSMKDRYVKAVGRKLAEQRLQDAPAIVTLDDIKAMYPIEISPQAWAKLTIDDFNWRVLIAAVQNHMIRAEQEKAFSEAVAGLSGMSWGEAMQQVAEHAGCSHEHHAAHSA